MSEQGQAMRALRDDEPLMIAWKTWQGSTDWSNARKWGAAATIAGDEVGNLKISHPHLEGSLWGAFMAGWKSAVAKICEHANVVVDRDGLKVCKTCGENVHL